MASRVFRAYAIFSSEDGVRIEVSVGPLDSPRKAHVKIMEKCSNLFNRIGTDGYKVVSANVYESIANDSVRAVDYGWFLDNAIHNKLFAKGSVCSTK